MTASKQEPHCDHECVCCDYPDFIAKGGACTSTCSHDTRSHSSAAEPAPDLSHIREDRRGCLNCLNPDCPVWQTADQNCWKSQKEHDAATKQAAREEVIQQFIDFGMSGKCVKTDKAEAVSCDAICERDCFVCFAESLRGGDAP